jgi:hypothetical protein
MNTILDPGSVKKRTPLSMMWKFHVRVEWSSLQQIVNKIISKILKSR